MHLRYYTQQTALNKDLPAMNWRHIASTVLKCKAWRFDLGEVSGKNLQHSLLASIVTYKDKEFVTPNTHQYLD